jgi:hypothetical protein
MCFGCCPMLCSNVVYLSALLVPSAGRRFLPALLVFGFLGLVGCLGGARIRISALEDLLKHCLSTCTRSFILISWWAIHVVLISCYGASHDAPPVLVLQGPPKVRISCQIDMILASNFGRLTMHLQCWCYKITANVYESTKWASNDASQKPQSQPNPPQDPPKRGPEVPKIT